jgi:hypothetical protein
MRLLLRKHLRSGKGFMMASAQQSARNLKVCLAAAYNETKALYNGLCYEACQAIASTCNAEIIAPDRKERGLIGRITSGAHYLTTGRPLPQAQAQEVEVPKGFDLFLFIGMTPASLLTLSSLKGWRESAKKSAVFLYETWSAQASSNRNFLALLDQFDHVFLANYLSVPTIQQFTTTPCSYMPDAADCLKSMPVDTRHPRPIDIFGMGRTDEAVHAKLIEMDRQDKLIYIWDRGQGFLGNGYDVARTRTRQMMRRSRFVMSFSFREGAKIKEAQGEEAVPSRIFEGIATGAVLLGTSPKFSQYYRLFDWEDMCIEVPENSDHIPEFYKEISMDINRIQRASILNTYNSLLKHDWAYRWEAMLKILELPAPNGLAVRKSILAEQATIAADGLHVMA